MHKWAVHYCHSGHAMAADNDKVQSWAASADATSSHTPCRLTPHSLTTTHTCLVAALMFIPNSVSPTQAAAGERRGARTTGSGTKPQPTHTTPTPTSPIPHLYTSSCTNTMPHAGMTQAHSAGPHDQATQWDRNLVSQQGCKTQFVLAKQSPAGTVAPHTQTESRSPL